jgi:replicative DNA helicase
MDHDVELAVILTLLYDARLRDYTLDILEEELFGDFKTRYLFKVIKKLNRKGHPVNFVSAFFYVRDDILEENKKETILSILKTHVDDPNSSWLQSLRDGMVGRLQDVVKRTLMRKGIVKLNEYITQDKVDEALSYMDRLIVKADFNTPEVYTLTDLLSINSEKEQFGKIIPLGIRGLDIVGNWVTIDDYLDTVGMPVGSMVIIGAISGGGKSSLMLNIALHMALRGFIVDFYSLELPIQQLSMRSKSILTEIPSKNIFSGDVSDEMIQNQIQLIKRKFPEYQEVLFYQGTVHTMQVNEIRKNLIDSEKKGRKVDCVLVDYLDIMKPPKSMNERRFELDAIGYGLKNCGQENGCLMITCTQNNRSSAHKNTLDRYTIAGSFEKVNYCNLYATINEHNEEMEEEESYGDGFISSDPYLHVDKSTFGQGDYRISLNWNKSTGRFWDLTEE